MRCGKCDAAKLCLTWFWLKCTFSLLFLLLFFINFKLLQLTSDTLLNWLNFYLFYFNVYSVRQRIANNYCHFYEKLSITSLICEPCKHNQSHEKITPHIFAIIRVNSLIWDVKKCARISEVANDSLVYGVHKNLIEIIMETQKKSHVWFEKDIQKKMF